MSVIYRISANDYGSSGGASPFQFNMTTPEAGHLWIVHGYGNAAATLSITDSAGGSWNSAFGGNNIFNNAHDDVFYKIATGTETWFKLTQAAGNVAASSYQYAIGNGSVEISGPNATNSSVNTLSTQFVSTSLANDLLFGALAVRGGAVSGQSWNAGTLLLPSGHSNQLFEVELIPGTSGNNWQFTASWTQTGGAAAACSIVAFEAMTQSAHPGSFFNSLG